MYDKKSALVVVVIFFILVSPLVAQGSVYVASLDGGGWNLVSPSLPDSTISAFKHEGLLCVLDANGDTWTLESSGAWLPIELGLPDGVIEVDSLEEFSGTKGSKTLLFAEGMIGLMVNGSISYPEKPLPFVPRKIAIVDGLLLWKTDTEPYLAIFSSVEPVLKGMPFIDIDTIDADSILVLAQDLSIQLGRSPDFEFSRTALVVDALCTEIVVIERMIYQIISNGVF